MLLIDLMIQDGRRPFELVYHGQFDDSRPSNNVPVTGRLVSLVALLIGKINVFLWTYAWVVHQLLNCFYYTISRDLSLAIDCVLSGQPVSSVQKPRYSVPCHNFISSLDILKFWPTAIACLRPLFPFPKSVGCSIKWHPGSGLQ